MFSDLTKKIGGGKIGGGQGGFRRKSK